MVKLIHVTPDAEKLIAYMARVSSPKQDNPSYENLLKYLIIQKHWSPFEMSNLCVEIVTSRAVSAQILRHKSFHFQEFSERYSTVAHSIQYNARRQDTKNRQNSIDDLSQDTKEWFNEAQHEIYNKAMDLYEEALHRGVARESARFLLPLSTETKIYMNGTLRSWITYFLVRLEKSTQLEHREIALACFNIFKEQFPIIYKVLIETYPDIFVI